jgi:uncharacterized protein (UPF0335 family)
MQSQEQMHDNQFPAILYRVNAVEQEVKSLQAQLQSYVPARENELQLQSIKATVERIERDITDARRQITEINTKMALQETNSRERDAQQSVSQYKVVNRVLYGIVSGIGAILIGVVIYYLTNLRP